MTRSLANRLPRWTLFVLPALAILAARAATHTDLAARNPRAAGLLFLWVCADALALATIAKVPDLKPGLRALLGALAIGALAAFIGAAAPVRAALLAMPPVVAAAGLTLLLYLAWSGWLAIARYRATGSGEAALGEILPALLIRFAALEHRHIRIGLFSWNAAPDVPRGAQAFGYHRFLAPMLYTLLALQLFELALVHFLVSLWSETAALVLLGLSVWGTIWLVALIKSFRLYPVLIRNGALIVRQGLMIRAMIPLDAVSHVGRDWSAGRGGQADTLNTAILSSPNVVLHLARPIRVVRALGRDTMVTCVGLKLDEPERFFSAWTSVADPGQAGAS